MRKGCRLGIALFFLAALVLGAAFAVPSRAEAAGDQIDSYDIAYNLQPSGALW